MALYDLPLERKTYNGAVVKENVINGNATANYNTDSNGNKPWGNDCDEYVAAPNNRLAETWNDKGDDKAIRLESSQHPNKQECIINTSNSTWGKVIAPDNVPFITEKDALCKTSWFTADMGVQFYQEDDWYHPITQIGWYSCLQCNLDVGCGNCNNCYNHEFTGEWCPRCDSGCTSGCTDGCTAAATSACIGYSPCIEGCTSACTASCVTGCTDACTDCDAEYAHCDTETGEEEPCEGCDSCTSCDSCDGCVGNNVDGEVYWCQNCDGGCVGCNGACNSCTACTNCDGNVTEERCKGELTCTNSCTNGCVGCTTACTSCTACNGCNGQCQNNQNGLKDSCTLNVDNACNTTVACIGEVKCKMFTLRETCEVEVKCSNNNAVVFDGCETEIDSCPLEFIDYGNDEWSYCTQVTTDVHLCKGNCNTNSYSKAGWKDGEYVLEEGTDPTCDGCDGCTNCDGACTNCDGCNGCDTCDGCVGCDGGCASCAGCTEGCNSCTGSCASTCASGCASGYCGNCAATCASGCYNSCAGCTACASETGCSGCTGGCTSSCTGCDGCTGGTSCSGCTTSCMTCASPSVCATCARSCTACDGGLT